jgi:hypothetical protein
MKALFLDVDGVLNSRDWTFYPGANLLDVDHRAVKRVQDIVAQTGAKVILTSTWRLVDALIGLLLHAGVPVFDKTPRIDNVPRSTEIQAWLKAHPDVETYAILDDDKDAGYGDLAASFVRTDQIHGLVDEQVERVVAILGATKE